MSTESSGKPDAWKLARPVWGWGRGAIPRSTPRADGASMPLPLWTTVPGTFGLSKEILTAMVGLGNENGDG